MENIALVSQLFNPAVHMLFQVMSHEDDGISQEVTDSGLVYLNLVSENFLDIFPAFTIHEIWHLRFAIIPDETQ